MPHFVYNYETIISCNFRINRMKKITIAWKLIKGILILSIHLSAMDFNIPCNRWTYYPCKHGNDCHKGIYK